jgi:hypothetical protein
MNRWAADLFEWECCMRAYWWSSLWVNLIKHCSHDESKSTKIKKMKYFVCFHREWLYNLRNASKQHYCDHFQWFRAKSDAFAVHLDYIRKFQIDFDFEQCSNSLKWWSHSKCDAVEIILARLSSYSSDFNLIETFFSLLKAWIRKNEELARSYTTEYDDFEQFLQDAIKEQRIKLNDSKNLFREAEI